MNTLYQYIQSGRVIDAYLKKLHLIEKENEYQHFLSRLRLTRYPIQLSENIYRVKLKELTELFDMTPEQVFELALKQDSHGYLKELEQHSTPDIIKYIYYCRIADDYNVLRRNKVNISEDLKQRVYDIFDDETVKFLCKTSRNKELRELEGTLAVNGIGYLLYLWEECTKNIVKEAFIDLYKYYLDKVSYKGLTNRNYVYGFTHCVIDVSDFYTKNVNEQISFFLDVYPIGELYDSTATTICNALHSYTHVHSELSLKNISSDMLAELLVTYKLLLNDYPSNKWYDYGYVIAKTYQELCNRIDSICGYIRDNKEEDSALDLKRNEHTNILFILYSRL